MKKSILAPIKYLASADFALRFKKWRQQTAASLPLGKYFMRRRYAPAAEYLDMETFGMHFSSPIGLAAGYDSNGTLIDTMDAMGFGFVEVGAITPREQHNHTHPTLYTLKNDRAIINCSDIDSDGVERVIENIKSRNSRIIVGCNIAKNSATAPEDAPRDYLRLFRPLYQYADYFTVNICLNSTDKPYLPCDREEVMAILQPLFEFRRGQNQYRPLLLKISPDLTNEQIDMMADIMIDTPLDGIVACGGSTGRHGLEHSTDIIHKLGRTPGAMYGAPLKERTLEVIRRIYDRAKGTYPIIGCGGITSTQDAIDMLEAGATLVQLSTEFIYGGGKSLRNIRIGLNEHLRQASLNATPEEQK
ncbi:MAG: quinone-dependent dihydroorotate dehydrogenase [Alistipes sp.]|nr:quinone-dependent dihydroorotate dehydrogenase [Alistipes sp.]